MEREREKKEERSCHVMPLGTSAEDINTPLTVQTDLQCQLHSTSAAIVTEVNLNPGVHGTLDMDGE